MNDIFLDRYPSIDLHGEDRDTARMLVNDFVRDSLFLNNMTIVIIHGVGTGILRKEVAETLRNNKHVLEFHTDNFNHGCTVVKLKK